jgi:hypothetical protein
MMKKMCVFLLLCKLIFFIAPNNQILLAQQPLKLTQQDHKELVNKISTLLEENYWICSSFLSTALLCGFWGLQPKE